MVIAALKGFVTRNDVKILIVCTATGGVLQVLCRRYIKNNPELFLEPVKDAAPVNNAPIDKTRPKFRFLAPRGGALLEVSLSLVSIKIMLINVIAKYGLVGSLATTSVLLVSKKASSTAVSTYLRNSFIQNLPPLERDAMVLSAKKQISFKDCNQNWEFLFKILEDDTIPYEEKKKTADSVVKNYLALDKADGRVVFVLCIVMMLILLYTHNISAFYILLKSLIKAIREGRVTKGMARYIVKKLIKKGIAIDPELLELIKR